MFFGKTVPPNADLTGAGDHLRHNHRAVPRPVEGLVMDLRKKYAKYERKAFLSNITYQTEICGCECPVEINEHKLICNFFEPGRVDTVEVNEKVTRCSLVMPSCKLVTDE